MAGALAQGGGGQGGGTLTSVIRQRHQAKAAYRLLDRPEVTHDAVIGGHGAAVLEATAAPGHYLLIEDTTTLAYRDRAGTRGLGPIGEDFTSGLWAHSTLVVQVDTEQQPQELLGLLGQQVWARPRPSPPNRCRRPGAKKQKQPQPVRNDPAGPLRPAPESARWMASLEKAGGPLADTTWTYVADRESDIYACFQCAWANGWNYVIRAAHRRALAGVGQGQDLFAAAAQGTVRGAMELELPKEQRKAKLQVRSTTLELRGPPRPGGRLENHTLNVVYVREIDPPAHVQPVCWVLLTDLPVDTWEQGQQVVRIYRCRWLIEEFHKALKTGLNVEASQLSDVRRLSALIGILSVVAVFLLQHKLAARTNPQAAVDPRQTDPAMLAVLKKMDRPQGRPTRRWFWRAIAKLGGFQGRPSDGEPGWLTLWRGWQTLMILLRGYDLANSS